MIRLKRFRIEGRTVAAAAVFVAAFAAVGPSHAQDSAAATNEISGTCKTFKTVFATGANTIWANQPSYVDVEDSSVNFRMKNDGCVIARFTADASSVLDGNAYVRAVLDGKKLTAPGEVVLTSNDDQYYSTHSMEFVMLGVRSGKHYVTIQWHPADPNKPISLGPRMTSVWSSK